MSTDKEQADMTDGQAAYEVYRASNINFENPNWHPLLEWINLSEWEQRRWDMVAAAVTQRHKNQQEEQNDSP